MQNAKKLYNMEELLDEKIKENKERNKVNKQNQRNRDNNKNKEEKETTSTFSQLSAQEPSLNTNQKSVDEKQCPRNKQGVTEKDGCLQNKKKNQLNSKS